MKKIIIYYNNDELLKLIDKLKINFNVDILGIYKTGERAIKNKYANLNIIPIEKANISEIICESAVVLSEAPFVNQMYYDLFKMGIKEIYTLNAEYLAICDNDNDIKKIITKFRIDEKALIGYLETHVYNQCNLKCKGCTHFSNIDEEKIISLSEYENNISLLSEKFNINTFRLMGGEPLLNENLSNYLDITRKYFPNSNIDIATNGILLCSMGTELIDSIKKNNIIIKISLYQPIEKMMNKIESFLNKNGIKHFYGNGCKQVDNQLLIRDFHKCLTLVADNDDIFNSKNCFARECWFLKNTKISKCATPLLIGTLNKKYNTNYVVNKESYIDIKNNDECNWDGINKILSAIPFCKYCSSEERKYQWEVKSANQKLGDYVIVEEENNNE